MKIKVFKNKNKTAENKQPDYKSAFKVNEKWVDLVAIWMDRDGHLDMSLQEDNIQLFREFQAEYIAKKEAEKKRIEDVPEDASVDPNDLPF